MMQPYSNRMTRIDQLYAEAGAMDAPVVIHVDGVVDWANRCFVERFGVTDDSLVTLRIRELLWCIGIPDAIAGMIAEGLTFRHCSVRSTNAEDSTLVLEQVSMTMQTDGRRRMMLIVRDDFDDEGAESLTGDI